MHRTITLTTPQLEVALHALDYLDHPHRWPRALAPDRHPILRRAADRLRDALNGHEPTPIDHEAEHLADHLDDLHDIRALTHFRDHLGRLLAEVHLWRAVERARRTAAHHGHAHRLAEADALLTRLLAHDPHWPQAALRYTTPT